MSAVGAIRSILGLEGLNKRKGGFGLGGNFTLPSPAAKLPSKPAAPVADPGAVTTGITPPKPTPIGRLPDYTDMSTKTQRAKSRTATALTSYAEPRKTLLG